MKKITLIALMLVAAMLVFAACQNESAEESAKETAEETVEETVEETAEETKTVSPLPVTVDMDNLDNCTVAVSIEKGDIYLDDDGAAKMKVKVYTYDLYDMVDIAGLEVGDSIVRLGETVKIESLSRTEGGLIYVNGGLENGGFDLFTDDSTVYYESGFDDVKSYTELGEAVIRISTDFVYTDASNLDAEPVEYYPGDFLMEDNEIEYFFIPQNTSIVIQDGFVVAMNRRYIP